MSLIVVGTTNWIDDLYAKNSLRHSHGFLAGENSAIEVYCEQEQFPFTRR